MKSAGVLFLVTAFLTFFGIYAAGGIEKEAVFWVPDGLLIGLLLANRVTFQRWTLYPTFIASYLLAASFSTNHPPHILIGLCLAHCLQIVLATTLIRKLYRRQLRLLGIRDVTAFLVLVCIVPTLTSSLFVHLLFRVSGPEDLFPGSHFEWFQSNLLGLLLFVPLGMVALSQQDPGRRSFSQNRKTMYSALTLFLGTSVAAMVFLRGVLQSAIALLLFPLFGYISFCFSKRAAIFGLVGIGLAMSVAHYLGISQGGQNNLQNLQAFLGVLSISVLLMNVLFDLIEKQQRKSLLTNEELENAVKEKTKHLNDTYLYLKSALDGANLGIWDWNLKDNAVQYDENWCNMLGLNPKTVTLTLKTWEERVHPDDLETCYQDMHHYLEGETSFYENVHRLKHENGHWVHILGRGRFSEWDSEGRPTRFTGTHFEISAQKEQEQKLELVSKRLEIALEASQIGVWEYEIDSKKLVWDDRMFKLYEVDKKAVRDAYDAWEAGIHPNDKEQATAELQAAIDGIKKFDTDFRILVKDNEIRNIRSIADVLKDEHGKPIRMLGVNWDVTREKQHEVELERAKQMAIEASQSKSSFLANMSHEIRTPMNGVLGMASLLRTTPLNQEQSEMIDTINTSGEGLLKIINNILDLSKIDSEQMKIELVPFSPSKLAEETVLLFKGVVQKKGIAIEYQVTEQVPQRFEGDATKIRQILDNLVNNAIKFTSEGKVSVTVHFVEIDSKSGILQFSVIDSGIGIPKDSQKRLFESFSQADASITRRFGGTGLGLSISSKLARLMGGELAVESTVKKGSTFKFALPGQVLHGDAKLPTEKPAQLSRWLAEKMPLQVLVVDDNAVNLKLAKKMLEKLGYQPDSATNGALSVDACREKEFDLILMDMQMPVLDGVSATKMIRKLENGSQPKIIALTANAFKEDRERCLEAGMDGFLAKPITLDKLSQAIADQFAGSPSHLKGS